MTGLLLYIRKLSFNHLILISDTDTSDTVEDLLFDCFLEKHFLLKAGLQYEDRLTFRFVP